VRFDVSAPGRITVTVKRAKKRVAAGAFTLAQAGPAVVKIPRLKPGKYVVDVKVATNDGHTLTRRFNRTLH
jgi:methionine-rich copper-binding protein CopC